MDFRSQNQDIKTDSHRDFLLDKLKVTLEKSPSYVVPNLPLFMKSGLLAEIVFFSNFYSKLKNVPGSIFEFGCFMGSKTVLLENLRAIHEPYNLHRSIFAFDTFDGYPETQISTDRSEKLKAMFDEGVYVAPPDWPTTLLEVVASHFENNSKLTGQSTLPHRIIEGKIESTLPEVLRDRSIIVAGVFLDLATYDATKFALEAVAERLIPGSVVAFDQLCRQDYPGETEALLDFLAASKMRWQLEKDSVLPDRSILTILA